MADAEVVEWGNKGWYMMLKMENCKINFEFLLSLRGKQGRSDDCLQAIGSLSVVRSLLKRSGGDVNEVDRWELKNK